MDGVPVLAVEILSPSDKQETITKKIGEYLDVGVALVWIIEPVFRTVTIYRPDAKPVLVNEEQRLSVGPTFPGSTSPSPTCSVNEPYFSSLNRSLISSNAASRSAPGLPPKLKNTFSAELPARS